jgi:hypothetical protein
LAQIRQATPVVTGGAAVQELCDAGLQDQMSELAVQPAAQSTKEFQLPHRPGKGTCGDPIVVKTNHFLVQLSDNKLHHYNVC